MGRRLRLEAGEPESVELLAEISGVEVSVETSLHQSRSSIAQRLRLTLSSQLTGIRIVGSSNSVGLAELGDVVLKVGTAADIAALSIETCRDWSSLPEISE